MHGCRAGASAGGGGNWDSDAMQEDGGTPSRRRIRWRSDDADSERLLWDLRMLETKGHIDRPPVEDDDAAVGDSVDDGGDVGDGDDDDGGDVGVVDDEVEEVVAEIRLLLLEAVPTAAST